MPRFRHGAFFILVALPGLAAYPAATTFQRIELPKEALAGEARIHPVDLLFGPELEIVSVANGKLTVYTAAPQGFTAVQQISLPLPPGKNQHVYYGFARLAANEHYSLMILSPGSVSYYAVENGQLAQAPQTLFTTRLISQESPGPVHRPFDMALDLDNDGVDELLLPADNGFTIFARRGDSYTPVPLPRDSFKQEYSFTFGRDIPADASRPQFFTSTFSSRQGTNDLLFFDANSDGRLDLIFSSTAVGPDSRQIERYDVFLQGDSLKFSPKPDQSFAVPYDSQADVTFRDINQDGRLDAVLVRSNLDIVNPRTVVKFFIGKQDGYQIFTKETDRFVTKDPVGLVQLNDFNADGVTDFAMTFFSYQFGSVEDIVDLAFANKLQFRLQFFLGRPMQGFPKQPDTEVPVTLNTKLENFKGSPPVTIVNDLNGDKMMDMIVRNSAGEMQVFLSKSNYSMGASAAASFRIPEQATLAFTDINNDGLNDIIVSEPKSNHLSIIIPNSK